MAVIYEFNNICTSDLEKAIECIEILDVIFGERTVDEDLEREIRAELKNRDEDNSLFSNHDFAEPLA